ncbi:DUF241 domain-containing protein [Melia azedarach]|uniref:DUF241 domain-containing protein n=1 Tax=Melia azedarach TaxID=155640 RepID=A0ACC1XUX2_MELAZ|nr:DUF241 domain-containing protein [Melia azedarach]
MASKYHVRSISLPSRSHPSTVQTEEALSKIKSTLVEFSRLTSGSTCKSLSALEDLYICMDDLLNMASTQQVLSQNRQEKCMDEFLDVSVTILDVCGITRDAVLQIKENVQALQSAVRRRKGDSCSIENSVASYNSFRKKMKKDAKKFIATLKQMDHKLGVSPLREEDQHLAAVIRVVREVNATSSSIFQSLLFFLSASGSKPKQSSWKLVSKLMHKGAVACEEKSEIVNELEIVDFALCSFDIQKTQNLRTSLKALESGIENLETCLERMFRRLIRTRAAFLNIISQ